MSEGKVDAEIVRKQCRKDTSLIDEVELIDVSPIDFDDTNSWLYIPTGCQTESGVYNFCTWLKSEPEPALLVNRRSIDTRTFTRPKKRPTRTNFGSVLETLSSLATGTWKTECSDLWNVEKDSSKYLDPSTSGKAEAASSTFKLAPMKNIDVISHAPIAASGEEAMEIFLNMSDSKEIDSFINLMEPGVNDSLMKVSQPSIFDSSIISLPRDESLQSKECDKEKESSNLTRACSLQANQQENSKSLNIDETFLMGEADNNESYCHDSTNRILRNESYTIEKMELNETYNTDLVPKTLESPSLDKDKGSKVNLSSTFVNKSDGNVKLLQPRNNGKKELYSLDATYLSTLQSTKNPSTLDATYLSTLQSTKNPSTLDATYSATAIEVANKDENETYDLQKDTVFDVPRNLMEKESEASKEETFVHRNSLDSTFKLPIHFSNHSTPKNLDTLNSTFKTTNNHFEQSRVYNTALNSNFKAPTSLRRELLAEIHRSGDHRLDCTFNHTGNDPRDGKSKEEVVNEILVQNVKNDIPVENKYSTYKKEPSVNRGESQVELVNKVGVRNQNSPERKYYTFTKRAGACGGKTDMENTESTENVDATFVKPLPKQHIPRMLSKLPQFLQKSNPNLVSNSLKTVNVTEHTNASGIRYMKGSQSNIARDVEKSSINKLYSLGKMKSGSEQRLLELNAGVGELQIMGAGGSTESIESTQSAHSAPDLDDRLSICSDSSHNSYTVQPMNIEQLHRIVRMQEESLKQDIASPLNKRVLENTWVDTKKNSPPVLKNGIDECERDSSSPLSMDYTVKTSSPILSPTRSSQSINTDGHSVENPLKQQNELDTEEKVEVSNKPAVKIENKTRLRQPVHRNAGNRASNLISAIPRPASRIPAPRFVRPSIKNTQGEVCYNEPIKYRSDIRT